MRGKSGHWSPYLKRCATQGGGGRYSWGSGVRSMSFDADVLLDHGASCLVLHLGSVVSPLAMT